MKGRREGVEVGTRTSTTQGMASVPRALPSALRLRLICLPTAHTRFLCPGHLVNAAASRSHHLEPPPDRRPLLPHCPLSRPSTASGVSRSLARHSHSPHRLIAPALPPPTTPLTRSLSHSAVRVLTPAPDQPKPPLARRPQPPPATSVRTPACGSTCHKPLLVSLHALGAGGRGGRGPEARRTCRARCGERAPARRGRSRRGGRTR